MAKYYQFKVKSYADVDIARICNEAPVDQHAIIIPSPLDDSAVVLLRVEFLQNHGGCGKILGERLGSSWGADILAMTEDSYYIDLPGFRCEVIMKEDVAEFVQDYIAAKKNYAKSVELEKSPRKRIKVKVHYV